MVITVNRVGLRSLGMLEVSLLHVVVVCFAAEFGDYGPEYDGRMYLSETRLLPVQPHETELKIMEHHKEHMYVHTVHRPLQSALHCAVQCASSAAVGVYHKLAPSYQVYQPSSSTRVLQSLCSNDVVNCIASVQCVQCIVFLLFSGQTPTEADYNLLDTARKVDMYGMRLHPAKVSASCNSFTS